MFDCEEKELEDYKLLCLFIYDNFIMVWGGVYENVMSSCYYLLKIN